MTIADALLSGRVDLGALDQLVLSAALATWSPVALVSMMTDRQVTGSAQSVDPTSAGPARGDAVALEDSVCVIALGTDGPVRVSDARRDARIDHIPAVVGGVLGAYLGMPLLVDRAGPVGVLCVYDAVPRSWSESDERELDSLAERVSAELARIAGEYQLLLKLDAATPDRR